MERDSKNQSIIVSGKKYKYPYKFKSGTFEKYFNGR